MNIDDQLLWQYTQIELLAICNLFRAAVYTSYTAKVASRSKTCSHLPTKSQHSHTAASAVVVARPAPFIGVRWVSQALARSVVQSVLVSRQTSAIIGGRLPWINRLPPPRTHTASTCASGAATQPASYRVWRRILYVTQESLWDVSRRRRLSSPPSSTDMYRLCVGPSCSHSRSRRPFSGSGVFFTLTRLQQENSRFRALAGAADFVACRHFLCFMIRYVCWAHSMGT